MTRVYSPPLNRLVIARCLAADRNAKATDSMMTMVFEEDVLDRIARLQRSKNRIRFNGGWVLSVDQDTLVETLLAMARRIAT